MKVLFLCAPYAAPERAEYQHALVALAEGLLEHGHTFYGNQDYWPVDGHFLIGKEPIGFSPDLVIASHHYALSAEADQALLEGAVLIDLADGYNSLATEPASDRYRRVLRSHYHPDLPYRSNVRPWFFGLTRRIMENVDAARKPVGYNKRAILTNFRVAHEIRDFALAMLRKNLKTGMQAHLEERFSQGQGGADLSGQDLVYWQHTGRRHDPSFYQYLNDYAVTLVFGGFMWERPGVIGLPGPIKTVARLALLKVLRKPSAFYTLFNWDSWRMWEAFYSNSIPMHFDLARWGCRLPVMPIAGEHYLGVREYDFAAAVSALEAMSTDGLEAMARAGTDFARLHYSPAAAVEHLKAALAS